MVFTDQQGGEQNVSKYQEALYAKLDVHFQKVLADESMMGYSRYSHLSEGDSIRIANELIERAIVDCGLRKQDLGIHFLNPGGVRGISKYGFYLSTDYNDISKISNSKTIDYWTFGEERGVIEMKKRMELRDGLVVLSKPEILEISTGVDSSPNSQFERRTINNDKLNQADGRYILPDSCIVATCGFDSGSVADMRLAYGKKLGIVKPSGHIELEMSRLERERIYDFNSSQMNIFTAYRFVESMGLAKAARAENRTSISK